MVTITVGASAAGEAQPMTAIMATTAAILLMPPSPAARRVLAWGSAARRVGAAWRGAGRASGTHPKAPIQCGARPSRRRAAVPPRRSSLLHRLEELDVVLRALHALEEELDAFDGRHVGQEVAEQVDLVELLLGEEQL